MGLIRLNIVWSGFLQIPNRSITERVVWTLYNYDGYSRSIPGQNSPVLATMAGYAYIVDRHGDQIAAAGRGQHFQGDSSLLKWGPGQGIGERGVTA